MPTQPDKFTPTADKSLIGAAGVHHVASELSLRGLIALPTIRNTAGVDIVASDPAGTWFANIQVKTSRRKAPFWPVSRKFETWVGPNDYYVFLRWLRREGRFEVFCESAGQVAAQARIKLNEELKRRNGKSWGPCFYLLERAEILHQKWKTFGPATQVGATLNP